MSFDKLFDDLNNAEQQRKRAFEEQQAKTKQLDDEKKASAANAFAKAIRPAIADLIKNFNKPPFIARHADFKSDITWSSHPEPVGVAIQSGNKALQVVFAYTNTQRMIVITTQSTAGNTLDRHDPSEVTEKFVRDFLEKMIRKVFG